MYTRKFVCLVVILAFLSSFAAPVGASQDPIEVTVNDLPVESDAAPFMINGSILVPLTAIFEALGATVEWDNADKKAIGVKGDTKVELQIGSKTAYVNGNAVNLDVPGTIVDGRTMVPARFIAESFGADVSWDQRTRTVSIAYDFKPDNVIYEITGDINYRISTNRNIDTFLIAAGLYYNFNNPYIFPYAEERELYKKAKEYFAPYKDHELILNFGKFVSGSDVKSNIFGILLSHTELPELKQVCIIPSYAYVGDTEELLNLLKKFYEDTNAAEFFRQNATYYESLKNTITSQTGSVKSEDLIKALEDYTGNRQKYYEGKNIKYNTILSFYRNIGSFATLEYGNNNVLASVQFAFVYSRGRNDIDTSKISLTSVHEFLHTYVNTPVSENNQLIGDLSQAKNKGDYITQFYVDKNFPWNRIADENFVRAIEARIYRSLFGEASAMDNIITPETRGGFKKVNALYNKLSDYEQNRSKYTMIDDFVPELLKEFFK